MRPTVYIETSVVGFLTSRLPTDPIVKGQMLETRKWWTEHRTAFDVFASELVVQEASRGDAQAAAERLEALADLPLAPITDAARQLAEAFVAGHALPEKARIDALHLAICATSKISFLATWNCRHLANATLRAKIEKVCGENGYKSPIICTPPQLSEVRS